MTAILGIDRNASYPEIKKAYRKLVKKYHPDTKTSYRHYRSSASSSKALDDDETMIKKINAAFEILSDDEKRKKHDHDRRVMETYFDKDSIIHMRIITIGLNMKQIGRHRLTTPLPRILRMTKIIRILKPVRLVSKKKVTSLTIPYMKKIH